MQVRRGNTLKSYGQTRASRIYDGENDLGTREHGEDEKVSLALLKISFHGWADSIREIGASREREIYSIT